MSLTTLILTFSLPAVLLAVVPAMSAFRSRSLHSTDLGLVLLPAPIFVATLFIFNAPAQIGLAGVAYPLLVLWLCVAALYLRVFLLPRMGVNVRSAAFGTFLAFVVGAAILGASVPPLYE